MSSTAVCVNIPDQVLIEIDRAVFRRRQAKARGRSATRTAIITETLARAFVNPVANQKDENQ